MSRHDTEFEHDIAHPRDVRAGPGDAGEADRPDHLPETAQDRRKGRSATRLLVALVALGVIALLARALFLGVGS